VKLTVIGCSPAWPNPAGVQSGYLVEGPGRLLLDCGPGVLARLRTHEPWPRIDALVITHFHLDHWGDLVPWIFGASYGAGRDVPRPQLWLPPGGAGTLRAFGRQLAFADAIERVFDVYEYAEGMPFSAAGFEVTAVRLAHYDQLTFGLRVTNSQHTLAYTGDSAPTPKLSELARDADVFLCEATLARSEAGNDRGHLTAEEAMDASREAGARRLIVIHRPDELPLEPDVERAYDGLEVTL
jgi:ribonuclease BN (tRNA processing enzyme)